MKDVKNIIIICDFAFVNGGSEKVAIESAIGLANKGKNIAYFCATGPIDERLRHENIEVICLNQSSIVENKNKILGAIQGTWNKRARDKLSTMLEKYDSEDTIIHLHLWQKALSGSIIKVIVEKKFKVVFTMHHYFIACPNGGFFNYKKNEICNCKAMGLKCLITNCDSRNYFYKVWRYLRLLIEQNISRSLDYLTNYIYISELGKNALIPYINKNSNYFYVPNPIDIKKEELIDITQNEYYIYVGRLSKEKGVTLLAKAAKELKLNIIFIGEGECRDEIINIYPQAKITGWLNKEKVMKYIKLSRGMIFPTLWYEGMPLSVLECLANGIPVLVTDTCAAKEVINDGVNGFLFKNNNLEDLKSKIINLEDNNKLKSLSEEAYKSFWSKDYSLNSHLKKLLYTYNKIIKEE